MRFAAGLPLCDSRSAMEPASIPALHRNSEFGTAILGSCSANGKK